MKIVHIEDYFKPTMGYQINILPAYQVEQGHEVIIVTGNMDLPDNEYQTNKENKFINQDKKYEERTGVRIIRVDVVKNISNRAIFNNKIFKIVNDLAPDIVYVHGNDTLIGIQYILKSRKLTYPIVTDSHMLDMASKNKFSKYFRLLYKHFVTPTIVKQNIKVIRTQDDNFIEKYYGIPLQQAPFISYGSELDLFYPSKDIKKEFRKSNDIPDNAVVFLYAGKITAEKGGLLLANAFKKKFENSLEKEAILLLIGDTDTDYGEDVDKILNQSENRIIKFDSQHYHDLPQYYQSADVSVFPKQCSLSFYDVQASGLPVISEANNINLDRNSHNNGLNFEINSVEDFRNKITDMLELSEEKYTEMKNNSIEFIIEHYDYKKIAEKYTDILSEEYRKFHNK